MKDARNARQYRKRGSLNCFRLGGDMSGNYYGVDLQSGNHRPFRVHTTASDILPAGGCSALVACRYAPATELDLSNSRANRGSSYFFNAAGGEEV
jgi:hypothetical protein